MFLVHPQDLTTTTLRNSVLPQFEKIKLPPCYTLTWDGEYKSSTESADALKPGLFPAIIIMLLIIVMLFNAYRIPSRKKKDPNEYRVG